MIRIARWMIALAAAMATTVMAQTPPPYGESISLEMARKVAAGAEAEALRNQWQVVIAIVDTGGHLVLLHRLDTAQFGSVEVARQKAWTAAAYRRPTKVFQDALKAGGDSLRLLRLEGVPLEGGIPILVDGKIIGAIGVSGVAGFQDVQIAEAGIKALSKEE